MATIPGTTGWRRPLSAALAAAIVLAGTTAYAQSSDSHWGLAASFTPTWRVPSAADDLIDRTIDVSGTAFEVGLIRGRDLGGDWGLSFVQKRVADDSSVTVPGSVCYSVGVINACSPETVYAPRGMVVQGAELHKYIPFVTIKRRVQLGMNLAAGAGRISGRADKTEWALVSTFDPASRQYVSSFDPRVSSVPAEEVLDGYRVVPLAQVELAAALVLFPGFKVRASGGIDLPGTRTVGITATYLFGAR
jgi:hypothetical protein